MESYMDKTDIGASTDHGIKNQLYPVFLKLEQLNILLVGAGNVGLEKLHSLYRILPRQRSQ